MFINLHRTVDKIGQNLPRDGRITFGMLEKAYELTLRLRSQLLSAMYDRIDFGSVPKRIIGEVSASQTDSVVCLTIPEPLPGLKERYAETDKPVRYSRSPIKLRAQYEHVYLTTPALLKTSLERIYGEEYHIQHAVKNS